MPATPATITRHCRRIIVSLRFAIVACLLAGCGERATLAVDKGTGPDPALPPPHETVFPTVKVADAVGWTGPAAPIPAAGLRVAPFASGLRHPRNVAVLPNGDVLAVETDAPDRPDESSGLRAWVARHLMKRAGSNTPSANRITLLRDTDGDGVAETRSVLIAGLKSPFGVALVGQDLYVADTDALLRFPYHAGDMTIAAAGQKVADLPAGARNHHWTKNVAASADGARLYVSVGSNSNVAENGLAAEDGRAAIWEIERASGAKHQFATGLRNPNGLAIEPATKALWTAVNERDEIGSDLVPDYMTAVRPGGFYGWPYSYYGGHVDERVKPPRPDLVASAIVPDYALGPHTASLGLAFCSAGGLPPPYADGAFVGQHGSWNRDPPSGYKVVFVPFRDGRPDGPPIDVLTGFLDGDGRAQGRPVGVACDGRGGLLVADDVGGRVWRVSASNRTATR